MRASSLNVSNIVFLLFAVKALASPHEEQWVKQDLAQQATTILEEAYHAATKLPSEEHLVHIRPARTVPSP